MRLLSENAAAPAKEVSAAALKLRFLKKLKCTLKYEKVAWAGGANLVAGVDEVGRGSLFGPVVAAAVILEPGYRIRGLRDSKLIPEKKRNELAQKIRDHSLGISIAAVDSVRIDQINIYHASREAMLLAVQQLLPQPDHLLIDAMTVEHDCSQTKIIHGDALSASIAAASIIAKVERDRMIRELDSTYPGYDLASNKGYSAPKHIAALRERGPSELHRQSFAPVWLSTRPQEVLAFMEEEAALDESPVEVGEA
jgi:ribonuclease HII